MNVSKIVRLLAGVLISVLVSDVWAGEIVIRGRVTVDGKPASDINIEAVASSRYRRQALINEKSEYQLKLDVPPETDIALIPIAKPDMSFGGARLVRSSGQQDFIEADLQLFSRKMLKRRLSVMTADRSPVSGAKVRCLVSIKEDGIPDHLHRLTPWEVVKTSDNGLLTLSVPEGAEGEVKLSLHLFDKDNAWVRGEKQLEFGVLQAAQVSMPWVVKRSPVMLEVSAIWDPSFSDEPFRPNVSVAPAHHVVQIDGPERHQIVMNEMGVTRFYDIATGRYSVSLAPGAANIYNVTLKPDSVDIEAGADQPKKIELRLVPVKISRIKGRIVSAADGSPVAGASVATQAKVARTNDSGEFIVEAIINDNCQMVVSHPEFDKTVVPLRHDGDQGVIKLSQLPILSGRITVGGKPLQNAKIDCHGKEMSRSAVSDADGKYELKLRSGRYDVQVLAPLPPKDGNPAPLNAHRVVLHKMEVKIAAEGKVCDIAAARTGMLIVRLTDEQNKQGAMGIILATRDQNAVVAVRTRPGVREALISAPEGEYQLIVMRTVSSGHIHGSVKVVADETTKAEVVAGDLHDITVRDGRIIVNGRTPLLKY